MKKIALTIIALSLIQSTAFATDPFQDRDILQGNTIELRIPKYETTSIEGQIDGKTLKFYEITAKPRFDEPISRGEFLELLLTNHEFEELNLAAAKEFPDVPTTNPFYNSIHSASALGIIDGYQTGDFGPYDSITRGQIAKILVEAFQPQQTLNETTAFPDVPRTHIFFNHINQALKAELFQGYPDGLMRPDREINFSEGEIVIQRATAKEELQTLGSRQYFRAFLGIHRLSELKTTNLSLNLENETKNITLNIQNRDFPTHWFNLAQSKADLFASDSIDQTWVLIDGAKANPHPEQLWEGDFIIPTVGELTLGFGDKLYINGSYAGSHFGHDWANNEGTEVFASNHGIVTLAEWTPSYGNTVVIDHGQNVFTMYLHLSELKTTKDQNIKKGDLIALMGSTGIATGPHLHFTQFIGNIIVDSEEWTNNKFL